MFACPLGQGPFKTHISALFLTGQPLVPVNFSQFGLKLRVRGKRRGWLRHCGGRENTLCIPSVASIGCVQPPGFFLSMQKAYDKHGPRRYRLHQVFHCTGRSSSAVEQRIRNARVAGSIPAFGSTSQVK